MDFDEVIVLDLAPASPPYLSINFSFLFLTEVKKFDAHC